jgi:SAM-dependent methyltransferase
MASIVQSLRWSLAHRGAMGTLRAAAQSLGRRIRRQSVLVHPFDSEHGTDTGGVIPGSQLGAGHPHDLFIAGYVAVSPSKFKAAMLRWRQSEPAFQVEDWTFLDLGCGKGRAVLLASEVGFREVVGVELNARLAEIARANAQMWTQKGKRHSPIRIECADVTEMSWPAGPCLVFMYNPFTKPVMLLVAKSLKEQFRERKDELEIIYQRPEQAVALEEFELAWCEVFQMSEQDLMSELAGDPNDETRAYRLKTV